MEPLLAIIYRSGCLRTNDLELGSGLYSFQGDIRRFALNALWKRVQGAMRVHSLYLSLVLGEITHISRV